MMNRWIEHENYVYNLDNFSYIGIQSAEVCFWAGHECAERIYFSKVEDAEEFYSKIRSKLELSIWE